MNRVTYLDHSGFFGRIQIACDFSQYKVEGTDYHCLHTPGESINLG